MSEIDRLDALVANSRQEALNWPGMQVGQTHALLAIEARLAQLVEILLAGFKVSG